MGSALQVFNDFMTTTDSAILTDASSIVNEAVKNNYLLRRFMRGKGPQEILQGGKSIKDTILFDEESTFQYYQPNETFTWQNPQVLTEWEISWRFCVDHASWTDQEISLNAGGGMSKNARHKMYKDLKRSKMQRLWTSILNGMEDSLFAVPSGADMEVASGTKPYSIPSFITEAADGLPAGTGATSWTGSSTVMNINPSTYAKWDNQRSLYDSTALGTIFDAFDEMYLKTKFDAPPTRKEYFESDNLYRQFIAASRDGINEYQKQLRTTGDRFITQSRQDPAFLKPTYGGIEVEYVSALDTAAVNISGDDSVTADGDVYATEAAATHDGPRYWWINANYLTPVFHNQRYLTTHPVQTHPNQPFTHVMPVDCWYNLVCKSRMRQGIVSPSN